MSHNICTRKHLHVSSYHLNDLCPENNSHLKNVPVCGKCLKLKEFPIGKSCQRIHLSAVFNSTTHPENTCPEMGRYYCNCVFSSS